ncbi:MAG: hypothetical protein OXF93_01515 [Acidobacteria bacterium]|nr:hypothetical protein [Acidobacteriota bacterium]
MKDIQLALNDVAASSHRGAAFLVAFGTTWIVCGLLAYFLPAEDLALAVMFQGALGVPMAFGLQILFRFPVGHPKNPLISLSIYLAMTQTVAIPAAVLTYVRTPTMVPAVCAAILGAHFLPYAWLQQTRVYIALSVGVSLGSWLVMAIFGENGYRIVPWFVGGSLLIGGVTLLANSPWKKSVR